MQLDSHVPRVVCTVILLTSRTAVTSTSVPMAMLTYRRARMDCTSTPILKFATFHQMSIVLDRLYHRVGYVRHIIEALYRKQFISLYFIRLINNVSLLTMLGGAIYSITAIN